MIMQTTSKLYYYGFSQSRTYMAAALFVVGNMLLPQLFHLLPQGGMTWLPIYFFTLVGAYKYGWKVGLLTAIASPLANSLLFGMPSVAVLPAIITKSVLLAAGCGIAVHCFKRASVLAFAAVVAFYQVLGSLAEWAYTGSFDAAAQDFRIGIPGMLLQVFGGYLFVKHIIRK